jgi:hypothetical protein
MTNKEKDSYKRYIEQLDNRSLLEQAMNDAGGDDYDKGCFTKNGREEFEMIKSELYLRLGDWFGLTEE